MEVENEMSKCSFCGRDKWDCRCRVSKSVVNRLHKRLLDELEHIRVNMSHDPQRAHIEADRALYNTLEALGMSGVAVAFIDIEKRYV